MLASTNPLIDNAVVRTATRSCTRRSASSTCRPKPRTPAAFVAELVSAAGRAATVHVFGKGVGIAAPQIGIDPAAAIVRAPEGESIALFNPRIVEESPDTDEQYEAVCRSSTCTARSLARSPSPSSTRTSTAPNAPPSSSRGLARLVAHEVDHLHDTLYRSRMREGVDPIPVSEYGGTGTSWRYGKQG